MRIKIINPNTTQSMTNGIYDAAMRVKNNETEIVAVTPHCGPESIENFHAPQEYTSDNDLEKGANVLLNTVLKLADI